MEQDSSTVKERTSDDPFQQQHGESFYDNFHVFTAFDSDLKHLGTGINIASLQAYGSLSELDLSLPSTDLDLETRIFGRQKKRAGNPGKLYDQGVKETRKETAKSGPISIPGPRTERKSGSKSRRSLHMDDSDPEDHVFHPEIVPFEPSKNPETLNPKDPRYLLGPKSGHTSRKVSDPSTARYLKILVPQRDSATASATDRTTSETSLNLFESLSTSAAERLLLESPTDSPSHFRQAQLRLDTLDSDAEASFFGQDRDSFAVTSTPRQKDFSPYSNQVAQKSGGRPQEIRAEIYDFEAELKRLVVEIYSEKDPDFAPIPGSSSKMESVQFSDGTVSQARTELEKAFGGGDDFITPHQKPEQAPKMSTDTFNSMASTSDALALQKSVVGDSSIKPASMDEIAALLASVQQGQYQRDQSLSSLDSTFQSAYSNNNQSVDDIAPEKKYNSMSSLDETPSKIPADYVEPEVTPAEVNGMNLPGESVYTDPHREDNSNLEMGRAASTQPEGLGPETQEKKRPSTVQKRPTSLLAQNTTLAINSAIAHKYKVPPPDGLVSPTNITAPIEPKLFRSPVQAITTSKGGQIAAMEGLEKKQKPKKKKGRKGGKSSAIPNKLVSDTDTEPPSDTEPVANGQIESEVISRPSDDTMPSRDQEDSMHTSQPQYDDQTHQHDDHPTKESSEVPTPDLLAQQQQQQQQQQEQQQLQQHTATSPPVQPHAPEPLPTSSPEPAPTQSTPEPSSGSFLGLFSWGRRPAEKPATPTSNMSASSTNQEEEASRGRAKSAEGLISDLHSDSVDSGVDFIAGANGDTATSPSDHLQTPQPLSSSTPNDVNRIGRTEAVVAQQDTPQYSHPAPTSESVQKAANPAVASYRPPPVRANRTKPVDLGRLRSTPLPRASTYQTSRYSSPFENQGEEEDVQTVLREKAKLEGQLEMLMAETESALQSRTQLQSQVAILQAKLKAQGSSGDGSSHNRSALEADISSLKQNKTKLEQAINDLQVELDSKEADLEGLRGELRASETANQKLQKKLEEVKKEIASREGNIAQLQGKMLDMQGQVDLAKQDQAASSGKLSSLQTDVESLTKARDWFQEQLGFAQEVRSQLQSELSTTQAKTAAQASTIETLKTDNTKVKRELTEARHRMLHEKELIAKNLETIEADIVTREATFSAMQREKTAVQQAVFEQMDQMEEEKYRLAGLVSSASELERQLDSARQELEAKHSALVGLEGEKRELVKGLALAEEAFAARETEMIALQIKCNNVEEKLKEEQGKSTGQGDEVRQLKADKASLEAALASANEEKQVFDDSLQKLRGDLSRVETGFKQMRQELGVKTSQLEAAQMEGHQMKEQLKVEEQQVEAQQANLEASIAAIANKDAIIDELVGIRAQLEREMEALKRDMQNSRNSQESSLQANTGLQAELAKAREGFQMLEYQLQDALAENANLHGQIESLSEDHKQLSGLMGENATLRQKSADAQSSMHRELGEQKANVLRLGTDLSNVQKEMRERERVYEANLGALTRQLQDTSVAKDQVERELSERTTAAAQLSKEEQDKLFDELQAVKQNAEVLIAERSRLDGEVQDLRRCMEEDTEAYRSRIDELEAELQDLRDIVDQQRRNEHNNRTLALDLERERGRLAGVHQSHSALKQHTGMLESALAQRETAVAELSAELTSTAQERVNENQRLQKLVHEMNAALEREKQASQDAKKQLANEKGEGNRLRQDVQLLRGDSEEVKGEMKRRDDQIEALNAELARIKQTEEGQKKEQEAMRRELEANRVHMERLKRHLQDKDAQSPVLEDQMKTLAWQSEQKAREAESLREQLELAEKRQQIELDGVRSSLQMTNQELDTLKKELATTRKEKFAFQAKLSQLKSALQATLQQNKLLKAKLKSKSRVAATLGKQAAGVDGAVQGEGKGLAEEIVVPEIAYDVESLLHSDVVEGVSASQSRPLYAIQSCLQSIKDQMGALEDQMKEHTAAVNTSSEAWKEVGDRVRDLRKASADPIAPTPALLSRGLPNGSGPAAQVAGGPASGRGMMTNGQSSKPSKMAKQPQIYDL